jgi:hypothetical protein
MTKFEPTEKNQIGNGAAQNYTDPLKGLCRIYSNTPNIPGQMMHHCQFTADAFHIVWCNLVHSRIIRNDWK